MSPFNENRSALRVRLADAQRVEREARAALLASYPPVVDRLARSLMSSFDDFALRQLMRAFGLNGSLPGSPSSLREVATEAARSIFEAPSDPRSPVGTIADVFAAWRTERPRRASEIDDVEREVLAARRLEADSQ